MKRGAESCVWGGRIRPWLVPALAGLLVLWLGARCAEADLGAPFELGPPGGDGPVKVKIGFFLKDINDIDEEKQTFEFEGILTLKWYDDRQAFDPAEVGVEEKVYQGPYEFNEVFTGWWVQVVLANESGSYERQGVMLRIRPDGLLTYVEEVDGTAKVPMRLRRFPFDHQEFEAIFQVLGFNKEEVVLETEPATTSVGRQEVSVAQWEMGDLRASTRDDDAVYADGRRDTISAFVVSFDLARQPGFMLRVVVIPLAMLIMLSWSVFWMDRESLGDRMDISFISILTVVAFQIMVSGHLPRIPYFTLISVFLYISYLVLFASVVFNLVVGRMDRAGRFTQGDRVDRACRWIFPLAYFGLIGLAGLFFFTRY